MSMVTLHVDVSGLAPTSKALRHVSARLPQEIWRGLKDGALKTQTVVKRALREQSGAKRAKVIDERVRNIQQPDALRFTIAVSPKRTRINDFGASVTRKGVSAAPWQARRTFARSFAFKGDPSDLRARRGDSRKPIRKLAGPNMAKEAVKGVVPDRFVLAVAFDVVPQVERRIARLFG